jgi:hypothetical protein
MGSSGGFGGKARAADQPRATPDINLNIYKKIKEQ